MIKTEERCEDCKNATSTEQLCEDCIEHEDNYQNCPNCRGKDGGIVSVIHTDSCLVCGMYSEMLEHEMDEVSKKYKDAVLTGLYNYLNYHGIEIVSEKDGVHLLFFGEKIKMGEFK
jgi:hypothetical protein